ncbi:hypothetical protein [Reyranella sp.]|uniref:hypothetical protein n=1 Tax=Reyranella sp. TaxID=1929291 RepID=UPI003D12339D
MQTAAAVGSVASAGLQIYGGLQQASAANQAASVNSTLALQRARTARDVAAADAADIAINTRKTLGSTRAAAGASGLLIEDGSPLEALMDNAATGELNRQRRLWAGEQEARGFMVDAYGEQVRGWQGAQKGYAAAAGGAAGLLTGGSKLYGLLNGGGS